MASRILYAVNETAQFVELVRKHFPDLLVGDIEPYPSLSFYDHLRWVEALNKRLEFLGVRKLDFYRIDPNWAAFPVQHGSWRNVAELADKCRAAGVPFSLIYWASPAPSEMKQGKANRDTWHRELMEEARAFRAVGGRADQVVVQSWIGQPDAALPETDPATFSGSVKELLAYLRGGP